MDRAKILYNDPRQEGNGIIEEMAAGYWRWQFRLAHDVPGLVGYVPGQPAHVLGFSETKQLAIEHIGKAMEWACRRAA